MGKEPVLPKNIRQIGEISGREKICIEDYVMTYIHKKEPQEEKGFLGIFFGERQETEESDYVFIRGIFEIPGEIQEEKARETVREEYRKYFADWEIQGCCVIGIYPTERMKLLASWIPEAGKLIYHLQEQEETLYLVSGERYKRLRGYFVFYEQNRMMQEYLADVFGGKSVEKESTPDRAILSFREKVKEKGEIKKGNFLRMASSFFVITVLIIGAIVVNRIEDIRTVRSNVPAEDNTAAYRSQQEGESQTGGISTAKAQYLAAQQAAGEETLAGSDAFWEDTVLEDDPVWAAQEAMADGTDQKAMTGGTDQEAMADGADQDAMTGETDQDAEEAAAPGQELTLDQGEAAEASGQGSLADQGEPTAALGQEAASGQDPAAEVSGQELAADQDVAAAASGQELAADQGEPAAALGQEVTSGEDSAADQDVAAEVSGQEALADQGEPAAALGQEVTSDQSGSTVSTDQDVAAAASGQDLTADQGEPVVGAGQEAASGQDPVSDQDAAAPAADGDAAQEAAAMRQTQAGYIIKAGDTLADICGRYYGNLERLEEICAVNGIEDANMILPGQRIVLP